MEEIKSPFDIVRNINNKSGELDWQGLNGKYVPFVINTTFSGTVDSLFYANEMNMTNNLPKPHAEEMQYLFYYHALPKNPKRFAKYRKPKKDEEHLIPYYEAIAEYYDVSYKQAKEYYDMLTKEQRDIILKYCFKGGRTHD